MAEIEVIETIAKEHMKRYGYEPMTSASAEISSKAIAEAKKHSALKKQQAWSDLKKKDPRDYQLRKFRADYLEMLKTRLLQNRRDAIAV